MCGATPVTAESLDHHKVSRQMGVIKASMSQQSALPNHVARSGIRQATVLCLYRTMLPQRRVCTSLDQLQQQRWLLYNTVYEQSDHSSQSDAALLPSTCCSCCGPGSPEGPPWKRPDADFAGLPVLYSLWGSCPAAHQMRPCQGLWGGPAKVSFPWQFCSEQAQQLMYSRDGTCSMLCN